MMLSTGSFVLDDKKSKYYLDTMIGFGGFGMVFKAHRESDGNIFAVKTTLPTFGDSVEMKSFQNEIALACKVSGKNVIQYYFVNDGEFYKDYPPYIIMEYADGGTLGDWLNSRPSDEKVKDVLPLLLQLAEGMKEVNNVLIHRDIKPANILNVDGVYKITDFGLSKIAAEMTRTMSFKGGGTPRYMAPEAWDYSKNTIQMDMYSMGIVFYEILSGRYPYAEPSTPEEAKENHLFSTIKNIGTIMPSISPSIVSVINRMLDKNPKKRFDNWDEIITALNKGSIESSLGNIVASSVSRLNKSDLIRQEEENRKKKEAKEKSNYERLLVSQYVNDIEELLSRYVDEVNSRYAGKNSLSIDRTIISKNMSGGASTKISLRTGENVTVRFGIVTPETTFSRGQYITQTTTFYPMVNKRRILGWAEIVNERDNGFNILLVDSGEMYGEWLIMKNMNNFATERTARKEPFAFSLNELPKEIRQVQVTHIYRSEFENFSDDRFLALISELLL